MVSLNSSSLNTTVSMVIENMTTIAVKEKDSKNVPQYILNAEVAVGVFRGYISPLIAFFGIVGNFTAFAVFVKQKNKTRFHVYTMSLAISDSVILIFNTLLDDFFGRGLFYASNKQFIIKIDAMSTLACKLMEYISPSFVFISGYLLVAFSLDRTCTVYFPVKFQSVRYILPTGCICGLIGVAGLVISVPMAISYGLAGDQDASAAEYYKCDPIRNENSGINLADFSLVLNSVFTFFLPCILVLIFNAIIAAKLYKIKRARESLLSSSSENKMEMGRVIAHLVVSTLFLVFTLPVTVIIFARTYPGNATDEYKSFLAHTSRFISSFKDFNYAINGYLYIVYFPFYRRQVCLWMSCGRWEGVRKVSDTAETSQKGSVK